MEQNAKNFLKRISDLASSLTTKKISKVAHSHKFNEWHAYIWQNKPYWEDITWRVKEPTHSGEAEVHLGFYSSRPTSSLENAIQQAETLGKGKVSHVLKKENGIRLVWSTNLNSEEKLNSLFEIVSSILPDFLQIATANLCLAESISSDENDEPTPLIDEVLNQSSNSGNLPTTIPLDDLEKINSLYKASDSELPSFLKEVLDKYGFNYGGWIFSCSYNDILDEYDKIIEHFPSLNKETIEAINNLKDGGQSETKVWFETLKIISDALANSGGKLIATLSPRGGSDNCFLIFSDSYLNIPIILLYHFNESLENGSGWFDEFIEDFNKDYQEFINDNNKISDSSILNAEYIISDGPFGPSVDSNYRVLNLDSDLYNAALAGMNAAKAYC